MIDLTKYVLITDVSFFNETTDFVKLKVGGIRTVIIRFNVSNGALCLDANFWTNYHAAEAAGLEVAIYLVTNPALATYAAYVSWLKANLPADIKVIALDDEIEGVGTPSVWGGLLTNLIRGLWAAGFEVLNYSNANFFSQVSPWPTAIDGRKVNQWWARYLNSMYPTATINGKLTAIHVACSWDELKTKISALSWTPLVSGLSETQTGHIAAWQVCSSFILPGCASGDPIDISIMPIEDHDRIFGVTAPVVMPPPPPVETRYVVGNCYVAAVWPTWQLPHDHAVRYITVRDPETGATKPLTFVTVYDRQNGWCAINQAKTEWIGGSLLIAV